jgi:hypothetical protein
MTHYYKKALATILPTQYWNKLRKLSNLDYYDIVATHKINETGCWYCLYNYEKNTL